MSPSRNFPARAEPSYEGSESSRAELGHFNFRAETEPNQNVPGLKKSKSPGSFLKVLGFFKFRGLPSLSFQPFFLSDFLHATKDIIFNHVHSEFRAISPIRKKKESGKKEPTILPIFEP